MTPFEKASRLYEGETECTLAGDLEFHLRHGYVVNTPALFMLARAVRRDSAPYGPSDRQAWASCDTWLVWCMAGDIREAMAFAPCHPRIKWVAFARKGTIKFHEFQKIRTRLLQSGGQNPLKPSYVPKSISSWLADRNP